MQTGASFAGAALVLSSLSYVAVAYAALPDSVDICVKENGTVRVIGPDFKKSECGKKDKLINISLTGTPGPQGEKGDKGDTGDTGPQGEKGDKGDQGDTGPEGSQGGKGDTGDVGPQGEKGDKGDTGDTGSQGLQGDKGDKGDTGDTGSQGDKGDKGDTGDAGADGVSGWEKVSATSASSSSDKSVTVTCTGSKKILGGGGTLSISNGKVVVSQSYPSADNEWTAKAVEVSGESSSWTVTAYAMCADILP